MAYNPAGDHRPHHDPGPAPSYPFAHQVPLAGPSASPGPTAPISDALASDFPSISSLSKEDLQDLLSDPHYFAAVFETLPQVRRLREAQAELIAADEALIEKNNLLKPRLDGLRDDTSRSFAQAHEQIAKWRQADAHQADVYKRLGSQACYSRMLTARHEADRASERLASDFVDTGLMDEDEFASRFKEMRKTVHKRGLVLAKWGEGGIRWD